MYENKYVEIFGYSDDFLTSSDSQFPVNNHLLTLSKEEEIMSGENLTLEPVGDNYYIIDNLLYTYYFIYNSNKKIIASDVEYRNLTFNIYIF